MLFSTHTNPRRPSVVNGVLLEELPYRDGERIVIIWHEMGNGAQKLPVLNELDYFDYRDRAELFDEWTIATGRQWILGDEQAPELVDVGRVADNFFSRSSASTPISAAISRKRRTQRAARMSFSSAIGCGRDAMEATPRS